MKKTGKILLTDINADRNREESLIKYLKLLATGFDNYATIKLSMNLFTMYEMSEEISLEGSFDSREEIEGYIDVINGALRYVFIDKGNDNTEDITKEIIDIRDAITDKMKILTTYTDALEIYEYILNRREPALKDTVDDTIDTDELAQSMYEFVFSENDKMLVNTRIQEFIAQMPVRMTKTRFFDIITNSLSIYRGGEQSSVKDFLETIRDAALINLDDDKISACTELYEIYQTLKAADYLHLEKEEYDKLSDMISDATEIIQSAVTDYLMLIEIINDVLIILYTHDMADKDFYGENYKTSSKIIGEIISADDIYEASESFDKMFVSLEGAQESAYEDLLSLETNLDDLHATYYDVYDSEAMKERFDNLARADRLTSSSLFMDIENNEFTVIMEEADELFLMQEKDAIIDDFKGLFDKYGKLERRSIMAKVLSLMPVFFNTQQEILEYFKYALSSCTDKAEITACRDIVNDLMLG